MDSALALLVSVAGNVAIADDVSVSVVTELAVIVELLDPIALTVCTPLDDEVEELVN